MNAKKSLLFSAAGFISFLLISNTAYAEPAVDWIPKKLVVKQFQGTAKRYSITASVAKDAKNVSVRVVPELEKFVHVLPDSIGDIQKGQEIPLTVIVGFPLDMAIGDLDGTIQLRETVQNKNTKTVSKPLPVEITVKKWENGNLPPDPGEAGKQTLLGIDSDNDGVRDDVQIAIARHYPEPEDEKVRLALEQFAASWQYAFGVYQSGDEEKLYNVFSEITPAVVCVAGMSSKPREDMVFVKMIMRNTDERVKVYEEINDIAAGRTFPVPQDVQDSCNR